MHNYRALLDGATLLPECRLCGLSESDGEHFPRE